MNEWKHVALLFSSSSLKLIQIILVFLGIIQKNKCIGIVDYFLYAASHASCKKASFFVMNAYLRNFEYVFLGQQKVVFISTKIEFLKFRLVQTEFEEYGEQEQCGLLRSNKPLASYLLTSKYIPKHVHHETY